MKNERTLDVLELARLVCSVATFTLDVNEVCLSPGVASSDNFKIRDMCRNCIPEEQMTNSTTGEEMAKFIAKFLRQYADYLENA